MTRYTVVWTREALDELAELWLGTIDRSSVTRATAAVDEALAHNPKVQGKPLSEGLRRLRQDPLLVLFAVREQDRLVEVVTVRRS